MSAVNLLQPILDGVQRNNFFNGRLLSAEDLRAEQDANRGQQGHLAHAIGDGVAWGLHVRVANATDMTVTVKKGLALNRHLDLLTLTEDTDVALVPSTPSATATGDDVFAVCNPPRTSAAYTGAGAYVLVAAPASGFSGTALVSDPNTTAAGRGACGARFSVEGVRFRLVPMALTQFGMDPGVIARITPLLPPPNVAGRERLRNLLAHLCFGTQQLGGYFADPLAPNGTESSWTRWGAIDAMRDISDITDCDVPLALVVLTGTQISFLDTWSVRRKIVGAGAIATWRGVAGPRRVAESEAAFLQFQTQLDVVKTLATPATIAASTYFDMLPPAGWLPTGTSGFDWKTFLGTQAPATTTPIDAALVRGIIERSWLDEPFALATAPPVPLHVYEVPGAQYVVFARSALGNVRVSFSPAPTAGQSVDVQLTAKTGTAVHGSTLVGSTISIPYIVPGVHELTITAPDYLPVAASDVGVIGGRTVDAFVTLVPQPNGSILVDAVDKATDDSVAANKVLSITATDGNATFKAVAKSGKWSLDNLPDATYTITGTAAGFKSAVLSGIGPIAKGTTTDAVLLFEPIEHAAPQPPQCVAVDSIEELRLSKVRLCMTLKATEFEQRFFYGSEARRPTGSIANDNFRMASRRDAAGERGARFIASSGEIVYSEKQTPWLTRKMTALPKLSHDLSTWLSDWQGWIADDLSLDVIKKGPPPLIYVDKNYRLPKTAADISALPPAYAVFAHIGVPLSIRAEEGLTRLPMALDHVVLPWVMLETFESLRAAGLTHLNDLAWAWSELVVDATGDPANTAPYLIFDAETSAKNVNLVRSYYPGVTPAVDKALKSEGFPTDLSIANATTDKLTKAVKNSGFAVRLIYEARQIVPASSWSLEFLPFTTFQVGELFIMGIESQGAFVENSTKPAGKEIIGKALGVSGQTATKRDELIQPLVNEATVVLTRNAIALVPIVRLSLWDGVDPTTATKLEAGGITSLDQLAHADAATVAAAGNISSNEAQTLVTSAQTESLAQANVDAVLSLTPTEGKALITAFGADKPTLGGLLVKTPAELKGAFGDETRAGSVLAGLKQGFQDRGIR